MNPTQFPNPAGKLTHSVQGGAEYLAFLPDPLPPPPIQWGDGLVQILSEATLALGRLGGVGQNLLNPHLLIRPFMRREAVSSSRIEGTQASLTDLVLFEASPVNPRVADVREVRNYVRALEFGLERQKTLPVSLRLIRELHEHLMAGVRGDEWAPGEFRKQQNWIAPSGTPIAQARFVPPSPEDLPAVLDEFERYLHQPSSLPPLIRLAAIHYQFETIHPFLDGNGRVGRLLITLLLCVDQILPQPLLYLSNYFERSRTEYYDQLLTVSQRGTWTEWYEFFLKGARDQANDAVARVSRILALRESFHIQLHAARSSSLLLKLVDDLFARPATTVPDAARLLSVTHRAADGNVAKLVDAGILELAPGSSHPRVYVARQVLRALEE